MLNKGTCVKIVVIGLLAVAVRHFVRLALVLGVFSHYHNHYPGPCRRVENMQLGSEDFETLPNGLTFITSGFLIQHAPQNAFEHFRKHDIKGRIFLLDFKNLEAGVKELKIASTDQFNVDTFHPHGISVWEDKKAGRHVVFVVNHPSDQPVTDRIEKFVYDPDKHELVHQAFYSEDALKLVNDVQATGENSFYFTNSLYFQGRLASTAEYMLLLHWGDVVHFDGQSYSVVAAGMLVPNGVIMSKDGKYVYIAVLVDQEIRAYRRNKDNSLTLQQVFPLYSSPDNFQLDHTTGHLYVGCHPILYKLLQHQEDLGQPVSQSQVLQLRVTDGNITSVQELFYDKGDLISGSSTAVVYDRKLLIGSVHHNLVICDVNIPL